MRRARLALRPHRFPNGLDGMQACSKGSVQRSNECHTFSRLHANNMLFAILVSICTRMLSSIRPRSASLVLPDISLLSITPAIIYCLRLFNVQMMIPPDLATQSQSDILDLGKLREDDSSYFSDNRRG